MGCEAWMRRTTAVTQFHRPIIHQKVFCWKASKDVKEANTSGVRSCNPVEENNVAYLGTLTAVSSHVL
jgi:hypothetical protein